MYCQNCGTQLAAGATYCAACGASLPDIQPTASLEDDPAIRMLIPVGRSGYAIVAGYCGLFAMTCILAPLGILFGLLALHDIRQHPEKGGKGRAIFGLVMGVIFTLIPVGLILSGLLMS